MYANPNEQLGPGEDYDSSSSSALDQPDYMYAANTMNTANRNESLLDSAAGVLTGVPKFIVASLAAGVNEIYNIPASIGNMFGGNFETSKTGDVIAALNSDLGAFYQEHQGGVDLAGFAISSLLPGAGSVKILNAGQQTLRVAMAEGKYGSGMGKAMGLMLNSNKARLAEEAVADVANNRVAATILSGRALRAMGSNVHQGALEALAFETAVAVTMHSSPILEDQDLGSFMTNVAFGAGLYGIGKTAIDAIKLKSAITRTADKAALDAREFTYVEGITAKTSPAERLAMRYDEAEILAARTVNDTLEPSRVRFLESSKQKTLTTLEEDKRLAFLALSNKDATVANTLYENFKGLPAAQVQSAVIGLKEVGVLESTLKAEANLEKLTAKVASGNFTQVDESALIANKVKTAYGKTWGEGTEYTGVTKPTVTQLVDTLKPGEKISVVGNTVKAGANAFVHDLDYIYNLKGSAWDILKAAPMEINSRYILADSLPPLTSSFEKPLQIAVTDIPFMEKVLKDIKEPEMLASIHFTGLKDGERLGEDLFEFISQKKIELANAMVVKKGQGAFKYQDEIAAAVNIKSSVLSGRQLKSEVSSYHPSDMLAMQHHAEVYTNKLIANGTLREGSPPIKVWKVPQHLKMVYDTEGIVDTNNFVLDNMNIIRTQQKINQEASSRAAAAALGQENYDKLEDMADGRVFSGAVPSGAGPGLATGAGGDYGTLAATVMNVGRQVAEFILAAHGKVNDTFEAALTKLAQSPKDYIEWSVLEHRVRSIEGNYSLSQAGDAMVPTVIKNWEIKAAEASAAGKEIPMRPVLTNPAMPMRIEIQSQAVRDLAKLHIEVNDTNMGKLAGLYAAKGDQFNRTPGVFYPIPVDIRSYPHFASVYDDSITSGNHTTTLYASTAEELTAKIDKLRAGNPHLKIRSKAETERYFASRGEFEYEKTLSDNYLDVAAQRAGISASYLPPTSPEKIVGDFLKWHKERASGIIREATIAKYEVQIEELRRLGTPGVDLQTSKFGSASLSKYAAETVHNPFEDYVKTMLAIPKHQEYPWLAAGNRFADEAVSKMFKRVGQAFKSAKSPQDLGEVNRILLESGYKGAHYDIEMSLFANERPARGALMNIVQQANGILANTFIRWDVINAANNAISANVLLGAETASLLRIMKTADPTSQNKLAGLMRTNVPGSLGSSIVTAGKAIAAAGKAYAREDMDGPNMKFFRDNGFLPSNLRQNRDMSDQLAFNLGESPSSMQLKVNKAFEIGKDLAEQLERKTGNRMAEEFNRFTAAYVMKQYTDVAIEAGLMSQKEQLTYINTFVNRTQGNYTAAQRPLMFQGAIGQAVGLFQTYQFNMMQQLFRHIGDGHAKDAWTLLALQGTIHGMNGLPAFNAINTHIVGTASGNPQHRDLYDATYGIAGKEAGDWLMYGAASNMLGLINPALKMNLYTRGDINPRQVTIIPTDPASIPFVSAGGKFFGNLIETAKKLNAGGDVGTTILQGLEHNGLSRPLAGLAQTFEAMANPMQASYSTTNAGNVIAANDLLSVANLGRIAGAKPLQEAILTDATYRLKSYSLRDQSIKETLGESIKTTMIAGKNPTPEQIEDFTSAYVRNGGTHASFSKWATQLYKEANTSQANAIAENLKSPFNQSMQRLMGGEELEDFAGN